MQLMGWAVEAVGAWARARMEEEAQDKQVRWSLSRTRNHRAAVAADPSHLTHPPTPTYRCILTHSGGLRARLGGGAEGPGLRALPPPPGASFDTLSYVSIYMNTKV